MILAFCDFKCFKQNQNCSLKKRGWFSWQLMRCPADTDVFKMSSGRLKKVTTSCDLTRRRHDVWKQTPDLQRLEDVYLRCLEDVQYTTSRKRLNYNVFRTSDFRRLEDV